MSKINTAISVLSLIALCLTIISIFYMISYFRRKTIVTKKIDYLIEDITYKSEMLNSTVETISKVANYIDAFEIVTHKNMKSIVKIIARNKDDIYKIGNRIKKAAMGDAKPQKKTKSKNTKKGGK